MQSSNASNSFSTDPYYFPLFANTGIGPSTMNTNPVNTFDISGSFPNPSLLPQYPVDPSWFTDLAGLSLPLLNDLLHGGSLKFQPTPFPTASGLETREASAGSPITPTRRVQKGKRRCESKRIKFLQNDKYIASFTEARVTCGGCQKSIKLDTRDGARFYPGFWMKHRKRCKGVEEQCTAERRREERGAAASGEGIN